MKKITFCILMILSSVFLGFSQVNIGVGNTIYTGLPFEPVNLYSYSQTIYRASDINASGTITSIKWHFTGVDQLENSQDVTVYLAHSTKNAFASDTDWVSLNDLTLVYTGGLQVPESGSGWIEIPFIQGFAYNGTDNLIVAVKENHPGNDSNYDEFYNSVGLPGTSLSTSSHFEDYNPNPANPPSGYTAPYYPNIIFEGITQACPTPFNVHAETIGTETATIIWDAPVNIPSGGSEYYISTNPLLPPNNTQPTGTIESGQSITFSTLPPGTVHYIWVRSVCGNDVLSPWSTVYSFVTVCTPKNEFFESFDGVTKPHLPTCWKKIVRGENLNEFASVETEQYGQSQVIRMANGNSADPSDEILLIAPEIGNLTAGTHRLKFSAWDNGGGGASITLQIVTLSENGPDASYTVYTTIDTESSFTGTDYIVDFSEYQGTDTFVGFKHNAVDWGSVILLDNIRWELIPPCPDVDATTIEVDELITTESTATVLWANDGGESWEVAYGEASLLNPDLGTIVPADSTIKELTQLTPDTNYKVWVRSVCNEGNGFWIGPITFKTECVGVDAINENFDSSGEIPNCWSKLINGPTLGAPSIYLSSVEWWAFSTPNTISLGSGFSDTDGPDNIIFVTPKISNLGAGTHRFKFRAFSGGPAEDDIQVVLLNSNKSTSEMTVAGTFTSTPSYAGNMVEYVLNFDQFQGYTESYIGIRMNSSLVSGTLYIDDVVWEPIPPCFDTGIVTVSDIEINAAKLSWTPGGDETTWQVAYGPITATDPETQTLFTTTTLDEDNFIASANLTDLDPATGYKVWVRSMCGDAGNGQWSLPVTFITDCMAITSVNENFESVTPPALPACWSKILRGETLVSYAVVETATVPTSMATSGTNVASIYKGESGVDDDMILILPELSNVNAGTHRLTFHAHYINFVGALEIGTLDSNNPDALFTPFQDITLTTSMQYFEVDFADYAGTDTFIGFRINTSSVHTAILIDDVVWEPTPSCAHLLNVSVTDISDVSAEVSWVTPGLETTWQVVYDVATVTSPDGITPVSVSENPIATLSNLESGTQYNLWVRANCGDSFGAWFGPVTFKTDCTAVTAFSQNFDTTTTPAIPECWKAIKRGETLNPQAVIETSSVGAQSAPNVIVIYKATSGVNDDLIIVSPKISNAGAGTHKLTFNSMMQNGAGAELQIGTLDGYTNDAEFTYYESVSPNSAYQQFTIDFSGYNGSDQYIGIRLHSSAAHTVAYLDNIVWEPIVQQSCTAVANINENFDTTAVDTLPECWTEIVRGPSLETSLDAVTVKAFNGASQPNAINIFKGLSTPQDEQILVLPQVSNLTAGTHKLSFKMGGPPAQIEVGTMNTNTANGVFTIKETVAVPNEFSTFTIDFTNYTGTDSYIALRLNAGSSPFVSMYIDDIVWANPLGTGTFNNSAFTYYPNPVKDILNLSYDKNITKVAVYNVLGQEIMIKNNNANQSQLDMSSLASGTYLVRVTADNAEKTFKVIKQ